MQIIKKEVLSSTNDFIKDNYKSLDNYSVVTALHQTNGRGRMTRVWEAENNKNILMSVLVKEFKGRTDLNLLSLVTSVSVHKFLSKYLKNLYIKWPNDILVEHKKICGILLEGKINNNEKMIIIGIGININQESFSSDINNLTTSLKRELHKEYDIDLLIEELTYILINDIEGFLKGNNNFIDYIRTNLYGINEVIEFERNDNVYEGVILDINPEGQLIVKQENNILYFNSGEIKIKR